MIWLEISCHEEEPIYQRQRVNYFGHFRHHGRRDSHLLKPEPREFPRSRPPPIAWYRNRNVETPLRYDGPNIRATRLHYMRPNESPVEIPSSSHSEQSVFEDRPPPESGNSDLMSAADASFRSFLTEQLTRKQNRDSTKSVISRREKESLFKPIATKVLPDLARTSKAKRADPSPSSHESRSESSRQFDNEQETVMEKGKMKENEIRTKDSKHKAANGRKWLEMTKSEEVVHKQPLWARHEKTRTPKEGHLNTKATLLKSQLSGILKEDEQSNPHPLYLKHRSHLLTRASPDETQQSALFGSPAVGEQATGMSDFRENSVPSDEQRRFSLPEAVNSREVARPKSFREGEQTKNRWMNFRVLVGDTGPLKVEMVPLANVDLDSRDQSHTSFGSPYFTANSHDSTPQDQKPDSSDDNSIWSGSSSGPEAVNWNGKRFSSISDSHSSSISPKVARLLQRHLTAQNSDAISKSQTSSSKLLMHPMDVDTSRSSKSPSMSFTSAVTSVIPRTTIIDSVAIPLVVDVDNISLSGCPPHKCSVKCPGELWKLDIKTGCPTCDCCPRVTCDIVCPLGYFADRNGCPLCSCVEK